MTYPAICREAEYLIVGMGSNARKNTPALLPLWDSLLRREKLGAVVE